MRTGCKDQWINFSLVVYAVSSECDQLRNPCGNGGNCTQFGSTVLCECTQDFTGRFCEEGENNQLILCSVDCLSSLPSQQSFSIAVGTMITKLYSLRPIFVICCIVLYWLIVGGHMVLSPRRRPHNCPFIHLVIPPCFHRSKTHRQLQRKV